MADDKTAESGDAQRAVIGVSGAEARDFLNGLLTNSTLGADPDRLSFAALLTPQGKILHTMFVGAAPDGGVYLDAAADGADDLIRRLSMYKLRRKVGVEDLRGQMAIALGDAAGEAGAPDPRHPGLPARAFVQGSEQADWAGYDSARLALGIPEQGRDYGAEEVFPHDVNLDLLAGVDMKKGCFVGQEVVSRMHRKGGVRKRMCRIGFDGAAPAYGAKITDESGADLGTVRSTADGIGLALARIDRLADAQGAITADGIGLTITPP